MNNFIILSILALVVSANANALCEGKITSSGKYDLIFSESDFKKETYREHLKSLGNFYNKFRDIKYVETAKSFETWVGYRNSLRFIEGYGLKQEALVSKKQEDVDAFCSFINENIIDH